MSLSVPLFLACKEQAKASFRRPHVCIKRNNAIFYIFVSGNVFPRYAWNPHGEPTPTDYERGVTVMAETPKFCCQCSGRLSSIVPRTENEIEFSRASHYQFGTIADRGRVPLLQEGECDNCGLEDILIYYRIFPSNPVGLDFHDREAGSV